MADQRVSRDDYEDLAVDVAAQMRGGADVRDDYSGRGMRGATCLAVVGDNYALEVFLDAARYYGIDARLGNMGMDSVGTSTVYYWPHIEVEKEDA